MRQEIQNLLDQEAELKHFVRANPVWYRKLGRHPNGIQELKKAADEYYGRTWPQKIEKWAQQANMISMMIEMAKAYKESEKNEKNHHEKNNETGGG